MELDLEPITLVISGILYAISVVCIWLFNAGMMTWDMPIRTKMFLTIIMLPLTYGIVVWQKNK